MKKTVSVLLILSLLCACCLLSACGLLDAFSNRVPTTYASAEKYTAGNTEFEGKVDTFGIWWQDGSVTVTDTVEMTRRQEVDFRYMTCAEPKLLQAGKLLLAEGRVMTYDPRLTCEIEAFPVNDPGIERNWNTSTLWRIHFKAVFTKAQYIFTVQ